MYFHDICRSFDCLSLNLRTTATTQIRLLLLFVIDLYPNTTQLFPDTTMKARFRINTIQKQLPSVGGAGVVYFYRYFIANNTPDHATKIGKLGGK